MVGHISYRAAGMIVRNNVSTFTTLNSSSEGQALKVIDQAMIVCNVSTFTTLNSSSEGH